MPLTIFGVAMALARNPAVVDAFLADGHEIASHGLRWISYQQVDEATERAHIAEAVATIARLTGRPPEGWYTGRDSPHTRRLVVEHGGFVYDADSYADDLPYWTEVDGARGPVPHLVVPVHARHQRHALRHAAGLQQRRPVLRLPEGRVRRAVRRGRSGRPRRAEDAVDRPALPARRPAGAVAALARFVDYARSHPDVWFARRIDIARHWQATHPFPARNARGPRGARATGGAA